MVARDVAKVYRRFLHQNQFKTLKSALLTGSLLSDLRPDQTFTALDGVSFEVPRGHAPSASSARTARASPRC